MDQDIRVRDVRDDDWDDIVALEAGAYTSLGLSEERSALESKARASPTTCFVLEVRGRRAGYLLALPYPALAFPELTRPEEAVFRSPNLHLHDLVVAEDLRGAGLGKRLLRQLTARARQQQYEQISLIAVEGSHGFWSANGFAPRPGVVNSGGYGPGSVYMSLALRAEASSSPVPPSRAQPSQQIESPTPVGGPPSGASARDEVG
ncbi:GNAT family N-acetyltransferase [Streptomyces polygonati]|uniref:GNAT family N-acetyltransferase n=1 Tax=Streptomyces polygonati TaxID=1617087 RepID=A0ABV8HXB2_9ACTN